MVAHPYGSPIMGWLSDLQSVTPADLERFYRDYYAVNNLVLVIVGRFDETEALALVRKHFDDAPGDGQSTRLRTTEPEQTGARRVVHRAPGATASIELLVHAPAAERCALSRAAGARRGAGWRQGRGPCPGTVGQPPASRTRRHRPRAQRVHGGGAVRSIPGSTPSAWAPLRTPTSRRWRRHSTAPCRRQPWTCRTPRSRRQSRQVLTAFALRDDSNRAIADRLARFEGIGSYTLLPRIVDGVSKVTAADVRALASQMFAPEKHNVGWFVPQAEPAAPTERARDTRPGSPEPVAAPAEIAQRHAGTVTPPAARLELPTLPAVSLTTLPNGLSVGVAPLGGEVVHVRVRVAAGALHDPSGREGLALVTARAITDQGGGAAALGARGIRLVSSAAALDEPFDNRRVRGMDGDPPARRPAARSDGAGRDPVARRALDASTVERARDGLADETDRAARRPAVAGQRRRLERDLSGGSSARPPGARQHDQPRGHHR